MSKDSMQKLQALQVAIRYGMIDGSHHKMWVIDQMVRALTGDGYQEFLDDWFTDEEGCVDWDEGIAP